MKIPRYEYDQALCYCLIPHPDNPCVLLVKEVDGWALPVVTMPLLWLGNGVAHIQRLIRVGTLKVSQPVLLKCKPYRYGHRFLWPGRRR